MSKFTPNSNFKYYMYFIEERMNIFWLKQSGAKQPYTEDQILRNHKFTNVYRVLDRASQYLLKNVIYNGKHYSKEDMVFRILIYKHFNLPSTWDYLMTQFPDIDCSVPEKEMVKALERAVEAGMTIYSNAYMITASFMRSEPIMSRYGLTAGMPKYRSYMRLIYKALFEEGVMNQICESKTMQEGFDAMFKIVGVADFLAYQFVQDINYTEYFDFDDNSFCAAGPGTRRGIERTFDIEGKVDYAEIVKWVQQNFKQLALFYGISFISLPNHLPTVADLSNCFCETDKYMRGLAPSDEKGEKRIKQLFKENKNQIEFVFPPKWNVGNIL